MVFAALPVEGVRHAIVGAGPGEFEAARADLVDFSLIRDGREALQLVAALGGNALEFLAVFGGGCGEILIAVTDKDVVRENRVLPLKFLGLGRESLRDTFSAVLELLADGGGLLITAAAVIGDVFGVGLFLLFQIAILRLIANANGLHRVAALFSRELGAEQTEA